MTIDYDEFRRRTWEERVAILSALSPEGKAELVRSQVSGWLQRHAAELTPPQIEILNEAVQLAVPDLYTRPQSPELLARLKDLETRARDLLTPAQIIDSLTMQWGMA